MKTFNLPDLGEGLTEAEIVAWHVGPGDHVVTDQPLVSVETEKAVVEVPAPWSGTVAAVHGEAGETVAVGAPLVDFTEGGADTGAIVGDIATAPAAEKPPAASAPPAAPRHAKIVPAARRRAAALGLDPAAIHGTGPDGAVTVADVERAASGGTAEPAGEPLRGPRRAMAEAMTKAGRAAVRSTVTEEADVTAWFSATADVMVRLMRAVVAGCAASPALNAWYDDAKGVRRLHEAVDLGIAVDTAEGLFVPVVRDVASLDAKGMRARLDTLRAAVADRSIAPADMRGATITLSNFGPIGGLHADLVMVPPQVAILGAGRAVARPAYVGEALERRVFLPLSLTIDHRVATGGEAIRFLAAVGADLARAD